MDRRELLKMIATLTGGVVIGSEVFLTGCKPKDQTTTTTASLLSTEDVPFLDEVAETVLPQTSSPGAKAAKVGSFMVKYVNDCYEEKEQKIFREGIKKIDDACEKMHKHGFMHATAEQRTEVIRSIDTEAKDYQKKRGEFEKEQNAEAERAKAQNVKDFQKKEMPVHYFSLMKQLIILGFFTSKEGMTQAMRFNAVPGKWEACIDYKKGDKLFVNLDGNT